MNGWSDSSVVLLIAFILSGIFLMLALFRRQPSERRKWELFLGISLPIAVATLYIIGTTVYRNSISVTKGPVHWHADFRIFVCGEELNIVDPHGLVNLVGSPLLHEHGDNRVHIEGRVMDWEDITLPRFFSAIGGELTQDHLTLPTNNGSTVSMTNGQTCRDGKTGSVQVFVHSVRDGVVIQQKLGRFDSYRLAPYADVPRGDCVIIEFDQDKPKTEHLCQSYEAALQSGKLRVE